jgi:hypothetical protein
VSVAMDTLDSVSKRRVGRDTGPLSGRNSSKGSLLAETSAILRAYGSGNSLAELRSACLNGKLLRQRARQTRRRIWTAVHQRFFTWSPPPWVFNDLAAAAADGPTSAGFVGLVFVHYARRDRLTFEFVSRRLWALRQQTTSPVSRNDVLDFLASAQDLETPKWRDSTRKKVAGNVLTALRDFGMLRGVQRKFVQRPVVPPNVVLHVCRLLDAEGLRGRALLEARDWRLFLWEPADTASALMQLAQYGAVRFERSGRTVLLEILPHSSGERS